MLGIFKTEILAASVLMAASAAFSQGNLGRWISRGAVPNSRGEIGGAVLGNKFYILGGIGGSTGGYQEAFAYSPAENSWQEVAAMPVGLHHPNVGAFNGKLYVLGGCDHGPLGGRGPNGAPWIGSRHSMVYDPGLNRWERIKPIPYSTAAGGVAVVGGRLYVIGGVDTNGIALDRVQEYDPATDTWRERASMPTAREHLGIAVLDSQIYVVAGRLRGTGGISVTNFEVFSPTHNTWDTLPRLPVSRSGLAFVAARGRLYAMGGEWPGPRDINEEYDPKSKTWRVVEKMPAARHGFVTLNYNDSLYALGARNVVEVFLPPSIPAVTLGRVRALPRRGMDLSVDVLGRQAFRRSSAFFHFTPFTGAPE
ncbi:MAG: kelch repeat-containing protein [Fibrobacteria bacterium]